MKHLVVSLLIKSVLNLKCNCLKLIINFKQLFLTNEKLPNNRPYYILSKPFELITLQSISKN